MMLLLSGENFIHLNEKQIFSKQKFSVFNDFLQQKKSLQVPM